MAPGLQTRRVVMRRCGAGSSDPAVLLQTATTSAEPNNAERRTPNTALTGPDAHQAPPKERLMH